MNIVMKHHYDKKHMLKRFEVGDCVYLCLYTGYNIPSNWGKNKKVGQWYTGPFTILERVGCLAYHLELPAHWNIHNVINIAFLEPTLKEEDPFSCVPPQLDAVHNECYPDKEDCYDVEQIAKCTRRIRHMRHLFTEYLVWWKGFDESHDEWLREDNLEGTWDMVDEFEVME